jgi:hypothetical protein
MPRTICQPLWWSGRATRSRCDLYLAVPRTSDLYDGRSAQHRLLHPSDVLRQNIERIGDHATNIAETVFYMIEGQQMIDQRPRATMTNFATAASGS